MARKTTNLVLLASIPTSSLMHLQFPVSRFYSHTLLPALEMTSLPRPKMEGCSLSSCTAQAVM